MPVHRSSKKLVDPKVQGALVRRLIMHWCAFVMLGCGAGVCLQIFTNPFRTMGEHWQAIWETQSPFLAVLVFMLPVFIWDTLKLSHRFVGPVIRLRNTIREVTESGESRPMQFRDDDFWKDLADDFNTMIRRLKSDSPSAGAAADGRQLQEAGGSRR